MKATSPDRPSTLPEHFELGKRGELLAAAHLQQAGYQLVASNFTVPIGRSRNGALISAEIDLIAYDGPVLTFIEVKTRASDWFAAPAVNVDLRKQRQIIRAARAYRRIFGLSEADHRYDVLSVVLPSSDQAAYDPEIQLLRNFWSEERFRKRRFVEIS